MRHDSLQSSGTLNRSTNCGSITLECDCNVNLVVADDLRMDVKGIKG
jgi:hypothetical protein